MFNMRHRRALLADVGGAATIRLERRFGRFSAWLAVNLTWWLRAQRLEVVGVEPGSGSPDAQLPRGGAGAALGASFSAL